MVSRATKEKIKSRFFLYRCRYYISIDLSIADVTTGNVGHVSVACFGD